MPRSWYDWHTAMDIEDEDKRKLYISLLAEKKPYFMKYIYEGTMHDCIRYDRSTDKKALREFSKTVQDLLKQDEDTLTEDEKKFVEGYNRRMPVGNGNCVVNRICWKFEDRFDKFMSRRAHTKVFDYSVLKSGVGYTQYQRMLIEKLFNEYNQRVLDFMVLSKNERIPVDENRAMRKSMIDEFRASCDAVCSNGKCLCDIIVDVCYQKDVTRGLAWNICGDEIIENLLNHNDRTIRYFELDEDGDVEFGGDRFAYREKKVSEIDDCSEREGVGEERDSM